MPAPQAVLTLVENFERNLDAYRSGKYNETQVRRDFIDPLFKALGWDMDNSAGYAEAYRDVIHEDAIKIGSSTKAPDYSFRIGGQRKFFLEAKKPSVNVKDDVEPAFQLRRYAWSAKLPLSIVTDFEEFAVYDCRAKPDKGDKASKARLFYCTFRDYAAKWDEIAAIFSKEAVLKGSFDKYASTSKGKRGTTEVDSAFLEEIEGWRDLLARNIALRNANLSQRELNFAVQQTIDRIIFLRICEDRGIEPYGKLMALQNGVNVYGRLREMFRDADDRYNSGLFHFKREKGRAEAPDELTLNLEIDDKPLKEIFKNLYYPDCPYEFSVLGADILGSVYEQFLGKVIRLTAGNRAVVEDKPEVKKAGGVFYTPAYIVQYIVAHTVGKLLEGKTPKQAAGIAILDPACGSGSFLIGAYQHLLDWYLARYVEEGAEKHSKGKDARIHPAAHGAWRLTTAEKKRILLEHIYGVDIDTQAVEVTKLSLLLKMLEGESNESLNSQMKLFHERVLPDLEHNIQCGNSLIGPDFYDGQLDLDDEATQRINVFDWQAAFPQIFKVGGFDAVIGNPPYVLGRETFDNNAKEYLSSHFDAFGGKYDLYIFFTERAIALLGNKGMLGYIIPNTILANENAMGIRNVILNQTMIERIRTFKTRVFQNAQVETVILILEKSLGSKENHNVVIESDDSVNIPQSLFAKNDSYKFNIYSDAPTEKLIARIQSVSAPLGNISDICIGIQLGGQSGDTKESFLSNKKEDESYKKVLDGKNINRYQKKWAGVYVRYDDSLHRKRDERYFLNPKLILRQIGKVPTASYDEDEFYTLNTIYNLIGTDSYSLKYLLGIINSKLGGWFWLKKNCDFKTLFPKIKKSQIESIPIRIIKFENAQDHSSHDRIVSLVDKMLALHQQL
ncbi:MAG TPA: TaqI-like C-terminal specificity domain-containing protein, partial [Gallionella sp.]|nr:TaqI-like C-terminal specificity domain-containing protein [Gallionella sp.]